MALRACILTSAHPAFDVRIFHKECKSLLGAGYEVVLIAPHERSTSLSGVRVEAVPKLGSRWRRMLFTTIAVYKRARKIDADCYHFHDAELIPVALLLRLAGKAVVYDIHEDLPRTVSYKPYVPKWFLEPLEKILEVAESAAVRFFSGLIAATPEIASRFLRANSLIAIVQNYPLIEEFPRTMSAEPQTPGYVTYVGQRITVARGAQEMVRAMSLLPASIDARLKLVGSVESERLLGDLTLIPGWAKTDYLGPQDRAGVADVIQRAIAGLVVLHPEPNYINSYPVKLFEYMCAGIPVIASDFPIFRSIVECSQCGLLVDPLNPRELAAAIEYLTTHPAEAREMGARGRLAVETRYNWANEKEFLLDLYREVCGAAVASSNVKVEAT